MNSAFRSILLSTTLPTPMISSAVWSLVSLSEEKRKAISSNCLNSIELSFKVFSSIVGIYLSEDSTSWMAGHNWASVQVPAID